MSRLIKQMAVLFVSTLATLPTYALDGDTLVPTKTGHKAIKDIQLGELVLSKNETTNQVDYQSVSNLYNDQSAQTVYVSIGDNQGNFQTLKTSKTHPFFVQSDDITPSSEGYVYQGDIKNANWTDASSLKVGDKLLSENGTWQTVQSVQINQEPITAYHLTVNNNHTFFVTANSGKYGAWVHNNTNPAWINEIVKSQKIAPDLLVKGVHFNVGKVELKALPDDKGGIVFKPVFSSSNPQEVKKAIAEAEKALGNKAFQDFLIKHATKGMELTSQNGNSKYLEFKMLKLAVERLRK